MEVRGAVGVEGWIYHKKRLLTGSQVTLGV
jgi:hypothetical protein